MTNGGVQCAVDFNPHVPSGMGFLLMDHFRGPVVVYRHPSEWAVHMARATWHLERRGCPTWTDATECRCMLGGEA